jgi:hypothetical protein
VKTHEETHVAIRNEATHSLLGGVKLFFLPLLPSIPTGFFQQMYYLFRRPMVSRHLER